MLKSVGSAKFNELKIKVFLKLKIMKKILSYLLTLVAVLSAQAQTGIISSTPAGTLYPTVYGGSEKTYLLSQGGFGSFADN